mmetsp:Transcript_124087/g.310180  ORF Transcript_124087/g.310180 Transcript_124087/m.310180 type:complete len:93 (-) Transcript_124087:1727-2005(-)
MEGRLRFAAGSGEGGLEMSNEASSKLALGTDSGASADDNNENKFDFRLLLNAGALVKGEAGDDGLESTREFFLSNFCNSSSIFAKRTFVCSI